MKISAGEAIPLSIPFSHGGRPQGWCGRPWERLDTVVVKVGTDGGIPNFLRFLEWWVGHDLYYRGSLAVLFTSRQGRGTFKCCTNVYSAPTRNFEHDADFLDLSLMPPRTPYLIDVNITGFINVITP